MASHILLRFLVSLSLSPPLPHAHARRFCMFVQVQLQAVRLCALFRHTDRRPRVAAALRPCLSELGCLPVPKQVIYPSAASLFNDDVTVNPSLSSPPLTQQHILLRIYMYMHPRNTKITDRPNHPRLTDVGHQCLEGGDVFDFEWNDVYPVHVDNPVIPSPATGTAVAGKEKDVAGQMDRMLDQFEPSHATCKSKKP